MAHIANNISGVRSIQLFSGLPPPTDDNNFYPRARVTFQAAVTIAAKIAGNTQTTRIQLDLPQNYAYAMDVMECAISSAAIADTDQWENLQHITLQSSWLGGAYDNTVRQTMKSEGAVYYTDATQGLKSWQVVDKYTEVFKLEESAPRLFVYLTDPEAVLDTIVCSLSYHFSFLQYDVNQAFNVRVNAPMPVSIR